ncbi:hypothetical protein ACFQV8_17395 [Pseudonocardia benzenivorans]
MVPRGAALDAPAIATAVAAQVRRTGTHALPVAMLVRLGELRRRHGAGHPFLDAYLGCVLARHECRFSNRTYLALPLLERVRAAAGLAPDRLAALLMADVVRVERSAAGRTCPTRRRGASGSGTRCASSPPPTTTRSPPTTSSTRSRCPSCPRPGSPPGSACRCCRCRPATTSTSSSVPCRHTR